MSIMIVTKNKDITKWIECIHNYNKNIDIQVYPNIETFGANIHTLLSHGFFMKDGLMGEFAKDKIDTAIKYLNQAL